MLQRHRLEDIEKQIDQRCREQSAAERTCKDKIKEIADLQKQHERERKQHDQLCEDIKEEEECIS